MNEGTAFYRCKTCQSVVSKWDIEAGGCPNCPARHIVPTNLSFLEKVRQLLKHPKVWNW